MKDLNKYPPMKDYYDFYEYLKGESKRLWSKGKLTKDEIDQMVVEIINGGEPK